MFSKFVKFLSQNALLEFEAVTCSMVNQGGLEDAGVNVSV